MACDETFSRFFGKRRQSAAWMAFLKSTPTPNDTNHPLSQPSFSDRKTLGPLPFHIHTAAALYRPGDWRNVNIPSALRPADTNRQEAA